jgi:Effector-associated domain 1/Calcineurin-like phosphoesterase
MAGITWLHLSDWHQGSEAFVEYQKSEAFDRELLSKRLKQDILNRTRISDDLAKIDFFVFSGDVAFSGQKVEYQAAIEQLFTPILEATGLDKSRLFIVPGNHDLDRRKFQYLPVALTRPFSKDAEVNQWLKDSDREYVLNPFKAYYQFINDYTNQNHPTYASIVKLDIDAKKVALLGLNSALMCGRNKFIKDGKEEVDDYGKLVVGEPQLVDGLDQIGEADVRIAVIHHPFEWLMPFDRIRTKEQLGQKFQFILCGHEHIPEVNMIQGTTGHCLVIPAGAGFDKRISEDPSYTNAYNFVHLNFDNGQVTVYLRRWNNRKSEWDKDTYIYSTGQVSFPLPQPLSHLSSTIASPISMALNDPLMPSTLTDVQQQATEPHKQTTAIGSKVQDLQDKSSLILDTQAKRNITLIPPIQLLEKPDEKSIDEQTFPHPLGRHPQDEVATRLQKLTGQDRKEIVDALLDAYPNKEDLEMMLDFQLEMNLEAIVKGNNLKNMIFNLVKKAQSEGWLDKLILAAHRHNPGNVMLQTCYQKYIGGQITQMLVQGSSSVGKSPVLQMPHIQGIHPLQKSEPSIIDRNKLLALLSNCPSGVFNTIVSDFQVPAETFSKGISSQAERAAILVEMAERSDNRGLSALYIVYFRETLEKTRNEFFERVGPTYKDQCDPAIEIVKNLNELVQELHKHDDAHDYLITVPLNDIANQGSDLKGSLDAFRNQCPPPPQNAAVKDYFLKREAVNDKLKSLVAALDVLLARFN